MNERIKQHLINYCIKEGYPSPTTDKDFEEVILECGKRLKREDYSQQRWWESFIEIKEIGGMIICFENAITTGDMTPEDCGWKFDFDSVYEMEEYEEIITVKRYRRKRNFIKEGV